MNRVTSGEGAAPAKSIENRPELWLEGWPWPTAEGHKHSRGRLAIVGSGASRTGATRLAARAALRTGAGVVRVLCPPSATLVYAVALEAAILKPFGDEDELIELAGQNGALVIGPNAGVTDETRTRVERLAELDLSLVLDADAISVFERRTEELKRLTRARDVLTPHTGEFERIFPGLLEAQGREAAAAEAARRLGAVMVLKGSETAIAAPDGRLVVNRVGTPWLATSGSGDVLAGIVGALLAQKLPAFEAACAGVWLHAKAGEAFGAGLTAEDLPDQLPAVLRALEAQGAGSRPTG